MLSVSSTFSNVNANLSDLPTRVIENKQKEFFELLQRKGFQNLTGLSQDLTNFVNCFKCKSFNQASLPLVSCKVGAFFASMLDKIESADCLREINFATEKETVDFRLAIMKMIIPQVEALEPVDDSASSD